MTDREITEATIRSALHECESHLRRLERSVSLLGRFFPISAERLKMLDEERIEHVDQFIYRFTRLQDSMGSRLLPAMFTWLEEQDSSIPRIDMLNRLEQVGVLVSVERWRFFRNLRNTLAHDYPESIDHTARTLNALYSEFGGMVDLYTTVRDYYRSRAG